ncbi:MAG TPA: transposase, partial [Candidatus Eisenbergiella stercorigallinarum]|nr:transposase [Candidatus Eisenbergiella stercorigallinarum]
LIRQIHRKVIEVKQNPKMEVEYMTLLQRDRENIELGREEGRQEGIKMALDIIRLHLDGKADQEIAAMLSLRTDYVRQVLENYAGLSR